MNEVTLKIDGNDVTVPYGTTILEAAEKCGISVPTLCHIKEVNEESCCRICIVDVGNGKLEPACSTVVSDGMNVITNNETVRNSRRMSLKLMCENHRVDCDRCSRYSDCELVKTCISAGIDVTKYENFTEKAKTELTGRCIQYDLSKCILCRRCVGACHNQGINAIMPMGRGTIFSIGAWINPSESGCIGCGQCAAACPTSAITPLDETEKVWQMLIKKQRPTYAVIAPAIWKSLGEYFYEEPGSCNSLKTVAMIRRLGFNKVFRSTEFENTHKAYLQDEVKRLKRLVVYGCPGVKEYIKDRDIDVSATISEAPSSLELTVNAIKNNNPDCDIVYISTCTAIKKHAEDIGLSACITAPELIRMIHRACVSRSTALNVWKNLTSEEFDILNNECMASEEISVKKITGIINVADVLSGKSEIQSDCLELYACPKGCLFGGGQVKLDSKRLSDAQSILEARKSIK